jgi:hypothetical protein
MLSLDDKHWANFTSGYQLKYDASVPLKRLEAASNTTDRTQVLDELWDELHHQGDVGTASYLAVPHLIRIGIKDQLTDWRVIGLVALIEIQRHESPVAIPPEFEAEYFSALRQIEKLIALNTSLPWDSEYASCALAALAASKGQIAMAKVIQELNDPDLTEKFDEFLNEY